MNNDTRAPLTHPRPRHGKTELDHMPSERRTKHARYNARLSSYPTFPRRWSNAINAFHKEMKKWNEDNGRTTVR